MLLRHRQTLTMRWMPSLLLVASLYLLACLPMSRAQEATPTSNVLQAPLTTDTTLRPTRSLIRAATSSVSSTLSAITSAPNSTSLAMGLPTHESPPQLFDSATDPDDDPGTTSSVFNYYFLFLVVFGVLVGVLLWWLRRRKLQQKEQMRRNGQHALARDLEGWAGLRRYGPGGVVQGQIPGAVRRQEGLDEHGDAPPPYQPKSEYDVASTSAATNGQLDIPLRALSQDPAQRSLPPGYNTRN